MEKKGWAGFLVAWHLKGSEMASIPRGSTVSWRRAHVGEPTVPPWLVTLSKFLDLSITQLLCL